MKNSNKITKGANPFNFLSNPRLYTCTIIILIALLLVFCLSACESFDSLLNISVQATNKTDVAQESSSEIDNTGNTNDASGQANTSADTENTTTQTQATETTSEEPQSEEGTDSEITINVYYGESTGEYLEGEARIVSGKNKYVDAISEMMKDPTDSSLLKLIPETTKINSVTLDGRQAKVDLSQSFVDDRFVSDSADILLVYSIVNTLTGFDEIDSVQFFIDGKKLEELGMLDLTDQLFRRSDLIKSG
jgi:spore germination protein GerM